MALAICSLGGEPMNRTIDGRRLRALAPAAGMALQAGAAMDTPALLGGKKARSEPFEAWPKFDDREERALLETLRSGKWYRASGQMVNKFEEAFAKLTGAGQCLATCNGTAALTTALNVMGVAAGD